jgi:hypothetical protein
MRILLKEVPLYPADIWKVDFIVCGDNSKVHKLFRERYGIEYEYQRNVCYTIDTALGSELKGETRIAVVLSSFNIEVMCHELIHVLWHASKCIGFEMNYGSQEWQACMFGYLLSHCMDKKTYTEIK